MKNQSKNEGVSTAPLQSATMLHPLGVGSDGSDALTPQDHGMQTLAHPQSAYLQGLKIEVDTVSEGRQSLIVWINVPVAAQ